MITPDYIEEGGKNVGKTNYIISEKFLAAYPL